MVDTQQNITAPQVQTVNDPAPQGNPNAIPYPRFSEVVHERNEIAQQRDALAAELQRIQQSVSPPQQADPYQNVQSVSDLVKTLQGVVKQEVSQAFAPITRQNEETKFLGTIENYFASDPNKAALREDMNALTAQMTPDEQNFLRTQVMQGKTHWLDMLYSNAAISRGQQTQQVVRQNINQQIPQAMSPRQTNNVRMMAASPQDLRNQAKQTGDYNPVFQDIASRMGI